MTIKTKKPLPWNAIFSGMIVLVMVAGAVLMVTSPVWLTPPNSAGTVGVYLVVLVLWLPLLIVLAMLGYRGPFVLIIVAGILCLFVGLAVGGPNLSKGAIEPKDCTARAISPGQTQYTCQLFSSFGVASSQETLVFQGATGSGFMRKVSDITVYPP